MAGQEFPIHESLTVIDGTTVYKTDEWWKAVVVYERYGRRIGIYLWHWQEEQNRWVRKQKFVVRRQSDWEVDRELIDAYLPLLENERDVEDADDAIAEVGLDIDSILDDLED